MPRCTSAVPIIHVTSAHAATEFFKALGFDQLFVYRADESKPDPCYMGFKRDEAVLHVHSYAGVSGTSVYIWVDDVGALYREFTGRGVAVDMLPVDQSWGTREMAVRDADRNTLCFGQRRESHLK